MSDELDEVVESFKEIDRFIIKGAADMRTLQSSISSTNAILESKGWEIFSRFISGSGLWQIQNRVKASIQLINSAMNAEDRRRAKEAKRLKVLADIGRMELNAKKLREDTNAILTASGADQDKLVEALKEKSDTFSALMVDNNDNTVKAVAALNKMMDEQFIRVEKLRKSHGGLLATLVKQSATYKLIQGFQALTKDAINARTGKKTSTEEMEKLKAEVQQMKDFADFDFETVVDKGKTKMGATNIRATMKDTGKAKQLNKEQLEVLQEIKDKLVEIDEKEEEQVTYAKFQSGFISFLKAPFSNIALLAGKIFEKITKIVSFFIKLAATFFVLLLSIILLKKIFTEFKDDFIAAFDAMKQVFMVGFSLIQSGLGDVFAGVQGMIEAVVAMDLMALVESFGVVLLGIAKIAVGLFVAAFTTIIVGAVEFMSSLFSKGFATASSKLGGIIAGVANVVRGVTKVIGTIVTIVGLVMVLATGVAALPILLAGLAILIISKIFEFVRDNADKIAGVIRTIGAFLSGAVNGIISFMSDIKQFLSDLPTEIGIAIKNSLEGPAKSIKGIGGKIKSGISDGFNKITRRAVGGPARGLTLVGEQGPELVTLPSGSRVFTNRQSSAMMGGVTNNITVQVTGRVGANDAEIRDIANKVAREINTRINRTSTSVVKF